MIRLEAVETIRTLKPAGASIALVKALQSSDNYRMGKAVWVPKAALRALAEIRDPSIAVQLRPLLDHHSDPHLIQETQATLEKLLGSSANYSKLSTKSKSEFWRERLKALALSQNSETIHSDQISSSSAARVPASK